MKAGPVNKLQVAFRSRIKFFFRPTSLKGNSTDAAEGLKWEVNAGQLTAVNNSPYHVTVLNITAGKNRTETASLMVNPFGRLSFKNKTGTFTLGQKISYQYINDWGAVKKVDHTL